MYDRAEILDLTDCLDQCREVCLMLVGAVCELDKHLERWQKELAIAAATVAETSGSSSPKGL
jgi:hypothetical protein